MKTNLVTAILLAGGKSRRFGGNKLVAVLPDSDTPICVRVATVIAPFVSKMLIMVEKPKNDTSAVLNSYGFSVTHSENAIKGMAHTLSDGVQAAPLGTDFLIVLSDMPFVTETIVNKILCLMASTNKITVPLFCGEMGHPVGFPAIYREELTNLKGDTGAKEIIQRHSSNVAFIEINNDGVVKDIDTRADLEPR